MQPKKEPESHCRVPDVHSKKIPDNYPLWNGGCCKKCNIYTDFKLPIELNTDIRNSFYVILPNNIFANSKVFKSYVKMEECHKNNSEEDCMQGPPNSICDDFEKSSNFDDENRVPKSNDNKDVKRSNDYNDGSENENEDDDFDSDDHINSDNSLFDSDETFTESSESSSEHDEIEDDSSDSF